MHQFSQALTLGVQLPIDPVEAAAAMRAAIDEAVYRHRINIPANAIILSTDTCPVPLSSDCYVLTIVLGWTA